MRQEGKDTTKLDIFVTSRSGGQGADQETASLIHGFNDALSKGPESERTKEFKDELFVNGLGEDPHGRRCTGTRNKLKKSSSRNFQTTQIAGQIEDLRRLKDEVTHGKKEVEQMKLELMNQKEDLAKEKERMVDEVRRDFKDQLEHMKLSMNFFTSLIDPATLQSALSRVTAHGVKFMDALNGTHEPRLNTDENFPHISNFSTSHEVITENTTRETSIDDYIPIKVTTENMKENDIYDCGPVKVGSDVILFCSEIPKEIVGEGVLLSMDPNEKIDGIALGHEFVKVVIRKAIQPAYFLMRPRTGVSSVGDAVGKSVAWEYVNVMEK